MSSSASARVEQFTPGPWHAYEGLRTWYIEGGPTTMSTRLAETDTGANASLIAAAPDLYAACAEFVRKVEAGEARSTDSYQQMKAALARARGESA